FEHVISEAAADNEPQIQILKPVVLIVVKDVYKQMGVDVSIIRPASADRLCGIRNSILDQAACIDLVQIQPDLVIAGDSRGEEVRGERSGLRVAPGRGQSHVNVTAP